MRDKITIGPEFLYRASFRFLSSTTELADDIVGYEMPGSIAEIGETDKKNVLEIRKRNLDKNVSTTGNEVAKKRLILKST